MHSHSMAISKYNRQIHVLILVVMDDALAHGLQIVEVTQGMNVLILVVMDDALALLTQSLIDLLEQES